jgi:hypothetical protein
MRTRSVDVVAVIVSTIVGMGCPPKPKEAELPDGKVTSIEAVPAEVQVAPGQAPAAQTREFRVFAWYRDGDSIVPGRNDPKQWKLSGTTGDANEDKVTVKTFPASGSQSADVRIWKAGDDKVSDTVKLTLWADADAAKALGDVVDAPHEPGYVPNVVLLEEKAGGQCEWGTPRAFVGVAAVDEQSDNPCSLALFSGKKGMFFQDNRRGDQWTATPWAAKGAIFPLKPDTMLELRVNVFLAVSPSMIASATSTAQSTGSPTEDFVVDPEKLARTDVEWANALYEDNRVGVRINVLQYHPLPASDDLSAMVGADPYDCVIPPSLPSDPTKPDYAYEPAAVSVYYVDRINFPPDPIPARVRGIQCHYWYSGNPAGTPPGNGPVIFVSYSHHSPTTLAHELGHALGLNDEEGKLGRLNIMHNLLPDGPLGADARSRFKVGQAFRMNVWNVSWINTRLPIPPHRTCDDAQHCPPMDWDVR